MGAQTFTARQTAALVAKRTGRPMSDKRVRGWVRDHVQRFMDDGYTTHAYTAAERDRIVSALVARSRPDATGTAGRASSASRGRPATKTPVKTRKATVKVPAAPSVPDATA